MGLELLAAFDSWEDCNFSKTTLRLLKCEEKLINLKKFVILLRKKHSYLLSYIGNMLM
jgi:hypothetical protein